MFDKYSLPELVKRAKEIFERDGEIGLHNYRYYSYECGCMGPSKGETLCPCKKGHSLKTNMVEVVAQFDEEMAKRIWLGRFVANLPG
jgi:hypothetical protein